MAEVGDKDILDVVALRQQPLIFSGEEQNSDQAGDRILKIAEEFAAIFRRGPSRWALRLRPRRNLLKRRARRGCFGDGKNRQRTVHNGQETDSPRMQLRST